MAEVFNQVKPAPTKKDISAIWDSENELKTSYYRSDPFIKICIADLKKKADYV